ncbi:hypothetical protein Bca4012_071781 [Brassica carinata]
MGPCQHHQCSDSHPTVPLSTHVKTTRSTACHTLTSQFHLDHRKHHPIQDHQAFISIWGEGAEEKALELNGSDMGGFKLVVVSCEQPVENCPRPVDDAFPPRFANPKKTSRYKMKKKKANRKKAWK